MYANKTDENNKQRLKSDLHVILPVIRTLAAVFYRSAGDRYTRLPLYILLITAYSYFINTIRHLRSYPCIVQNEE